MEIELRRARPEDREKLIEVESKSTPNLSYIPEVFDEFISDEGGEFIVAEADGEVVACGKFTVVPDGSAWLETLRVVPERQGLGIGKRFYERFFKIARNRGVKTMRMYTGVRNVVSRSLAERFGFRLTNTFRGAWLPCESWTGGTSTGDFRVVTDPERATSLLMPHREMWGGFLVMNRTFYTLTPALCAYLARREMVYEETVGGSVTALGARFMPERALHIGVFGGDVRACLGFSARECRERRAGRLSCLFPASSVELQGELTRRGFQLEASDFLVMEARVSG